MNWIRRHLDGIMILTGLSLSIGTAGFVAYQYFFPKPDFTITFSVVIDDPTLEDVLSRFGQDEIEAYIRGQYLPLMLTEDCGPTLKAENGMLRQSLEDCGCEVEEDLEPTEEECPQMSACIDSECSDNWSSGNLILSNSASAGNLRDDSPKTSHDAFYYQSDGWTEFH